MTAHLCDDAGVACERSRTRHPQSMLDGFEAGILPSHWSMVDGGLVGSGCGTLLPVAHGKSLYFDGCGQRQAVTIELDLTKARYYLVSYVLLFISLYSENYHQAMYYNVLPLPQTTNCVIPLLHAGHI